MYIHFRLLNLSAWLTVLLVLFIPGRQAFDGNQRTEFGVPFKYITRYDHASNNGSWILDNASIDILPFIINVAAIYSVLLVIRSLRHKYKRKGIGKEI